MLVKVSGKRKLYFSKDTLLLATVYHLTYSFKIVIKIKLATSYHKKEENHNKTRDDKVLPSVTWMVFLKEVEA